MNRLLLTAATALTMAASSHAMAATYALDNYSGALSMGGANFQANGVGDGISSTVSNYSLGGFTFSRTLDFTQTAGSDPSWLLVTDKYWSYDDNGEYVYDENGDHVLAPMPEGQTGAYVQNSGGTNSVLKLTYNIGSLDATVGNGSVRFDVNVTNTDAGPDHMSYIDAYLDNALLPFHTETLSDPVALGDQPPTIRSFSLSGADLGAATQITFVVRGMNGFNTTIAPLTFDVLPVPEAGLLPMFGSGLLVVGFAARRKRRSISL